MRLLGLLLGISVTVAVLSSCDKIGFGERAIDSQVIMGEFIRTRCSPVANCELPLRESLPFAWTKFYYFDIRTESQEISTIIGHQYVERSQEYTRKFFFLNGDALVHIGEFPVRNIDEPFIAGDVDIDLSNSKQNFASFDADSVFHVHEIPLKEGSLLRLQCVNCR